MQSNVKHEFKIVMRERRSSVHNKSYREEEISKIRSKLLNSMQAVVKFLTTCSLDIMFIWNSIRVLLFSCYFKFCQ